MRTSVRRELLSLGLLLGVSLLGKLALSEQPLPEKPITHTQREIAGWNVQIDDRLLAGEQAKLGTKAIDLLTGKLHEIALLAPADRVQRLRKVTIWLDYKHGGLVSPQYHPSVEWLKDNGYREELARCVHFPDAEYFCDRRFQHYQPAAVLHELAHAYHDQVLDFENEEIKTVWKSFVQSGKYASILHISGREQPHYALTDQKEFFAEMTEAYLIANDFYPFNAVELLKAEPDIHSLLGKIWGPLP